MECFICSATFASEKAAPQAVIGRSGHGQVALIDAARLVCEQRSEQHSDAATTWGVFALPLRICLFHSVRVLLLHIIATEKKDLNITNDCLWGKNSNKCTFVFWSKIQTV